MPEQMFTTFAHQDTKSQYWRTKKHLRRMKFERGGNELGRGGASWIFEARENIIFIKWGINVSIPFSPPPPRKQIYVSFLPSFPPTTPKFHFLEEGVALE